MKYRTMAAVLIVCLVLGCSFAGSAGSADAAGPNRPVNELAALAQTGDTDAMTDLGLCYELGQGVRKDEAKSVDLYRAAAGKGTPERNTCSASAILSAGGLRKMTRKP